jgi:hypothetical protein
MLSIKDMLQVLYSSVHMHCTMYISVCRGLSYLCAGIWGIWTGVEGMCGYLVSCATMIGWYAEHSTEQYKHGFLFSNATRIILFRFVCNLVR